MSLYIDSLNNFFKNAKKYKKLNHKQIRKLNKNYKIGTFNTLGVIENKKYVPYWTIPVDKRFDSINENLSYQYLQYALTIFSDPEKYKSDRTYFNFYIRNILTKSNINIENQFQIVLLLSIYNKLKKDKNEIVILRWDKSNLILDKDYNYKIPTISQIYYDQIDLDNDNYYYKIYEIPKKYLNNM